MSERQVGFKRQKTPEKEASEESESLRSAMAELMGNGKPGMSARQLVGEKEWSRQIWSRLRECGPATVAEFCAYTNLTRYHANKDLRKLLTDGRACKASCFFVALGDTF